MTPKRFIVVLAVMAIWRGAPAHAQIERLVSPGPLAQAHAALEGAANCQKCHEPGRKVTADRCLACHTPIADRIAARTGVHSAVTTDCVTCHVDHAGVDADLRHFNPRAFDHGRETGFALTGRHAPLARDCARCHKTRSFLTAQSACAACHADPHKGSLGVRCDTCHSIAVPFREARGGFDHARTSFPLAGAHRTVACEKCHAGQAYRGLKFASCADCHHDPHKAAFGGACATCHAPETWKTRKVDHVKTAFPLRGQHAAVACTACHTRPAMQAKPKSARCADCHADVHRGAFKQDCAACHRETGFHSAPFDHQARTGFPLAERHAGIACAACHKNAATRPGVAPKTVEFRGLSAACASCHTDPHRGELGVRCDTCHTSATFRLAAYRHPRLPEFFGGQHAAVACAACHAGRTAAAPARPDTPVSQWVFKSVPTACASCHRDVHLGQLGAQCESCHAVDAPKFAAPKFSHDRAAFPLEGRHRAVDCAACHRREAVTGASAGVVRFKGLSPACASCHRDLHLGQLGLHCDACHTPASFKLAAYTHAERTDFFAGSHAGLACAACHKPQESDFPGGHGTAVRYTGFGTACATCHTDAHRGALGPRCETCHEPAAPWATVSRAFHKVGLFPLEGRHLMTRCAECHWNGEIKGTPTHCYDCHWIRRQDDLYRTRLGNECQLCHRPASWTAVNWNHGAMTGVQLSGAHRALGCDACHRNQSFTGLAPACDSCHHKDYERAATPNHLTAGFPATCDACHRPSDTSWRQGQFTHASFPLVGVHATQACAACHANGVYRGAPTDCYSCHRADYDRTQNPNHAAAGFPLTCEGCHQASAPNWKTGFNHNAIYPLVGVHATQACAACHGNGIYKGAPTACVGCHLKDYNVAANPNHIAAGFPTTCDSCHQASAPNWKTGFNHNAVYPLVGVHATQACAACHGNGIYKGTPTACVGCHLKDYNATTNPNHAAAGFPTQCDACHRASDPNWLQALFNHTWFPITSGKHAGSPCAACHTNPANYRVFTCTTCHTQSNTNSHHQGVAGYQYTSQACYSCHPNGRAP